MVSYSRSKYWEKARAGINIISFPFDSKKDILERNCFLRTIKIKLEVSYVDVYETGLQTKNIVVDVCLSKNKLIIFIISFWFTVYL